MSIRFNILSVVLFLVISSAVSSASAAPLRGKFFDHALFVVFENTNYGDAMKQPFFKKLAENGANLTNFMAVTHPSQGNYVALTSGALNGVRDDQLFDIDAPNVVDLLEAKGVTWKVYAEGYPGHCFAGMTFGHYARRHVPFISYKNIQLNPGRCAHIVDASEFDRDLASGTLPEYMFYVPDTRNDGHDTGVAFADRWYEQRISPFLRNPDVMANAVLITTFDENEGLGRNQIYTSIVGPHVRVGDVNDALNLYSLLGLIEINWSLGNLGKFDATAPAIPNIWR